MRTYIFHRVDFSKWKCLKQKLIKSLMIREIHYQNEHLEFIIILTALSVLLLFVYLEEGVKKQTTKM